MDKYIVAPPNGSTNNGIGAADRPWKEGHFDEMNTDAVMPVSANNSVGAADRPWKEGHFDSIKLKSGDLGEYLAESADYGIVSGCEPTINNLTVTVGAGIVHLADGMRKEIAQTNITLDNADPTNPRIDLVYIDSTGTVAKITGTAAANPVVPEVPTDGIVICNVTIAASETTGIVVFNPKVIKPQKDIIGGLHETLLHKTITKDNDYYCQGFCYNSKDNVFLVGMQQSDTYQKIQKYDTKWNFISEVDYTNLGHINTLTYKPDTNEVYVIVTGATYAVLDGTTLAVKETRTTTEPITTLCYNAEKNIFIGTSLNSTNAWYMYIYDATMNLIRTNNIFDSSDGSSTVGRTTNGSCSRDSVIILITFDYLYEFDLFGNMLRREYLAQGRFDGQYEIEDCDFVDNKMVMTSLAESSSKFIVFTNQKNISRYNNLLTKESYIFYPQGITDVDKCENPGLYQVSYNCANLPIATNGLLIVYYDPSGIQLIQEYKASGSNYYETYRRFMESGTDTWKPWVRIDGYKTRLGSTKTEIDFPNSTKSFTATDDGYVTLSASAEQFYLENTTRGLTYQTFTATPIAKRAFVPVRKGDGVYVEVSNATGKKLYFIANE